MKANKTKNVWEAFGGERGYAGTKLRTAETPTWYSPSLGFSFPPASSSKGNGKKGMTMVSEGGFCCFE